MLYLFHQRRQPITCIAVVLSVKSAFHIEPSNITLNTQYKSQQSNVIPFAFETRDQNKNETRCMCVNDIWNRVTLMNIGVDEENNKKKNLRTFPFHMDVLSQFK